MNRGILKISVAIFLIMALVLAAIPFVSSLNPSARAGETLQHILISDLEVGDFLVEDDLAKGYFKGRYLVIKDYEAKVHVYLVPIRENRFMLPVVRWWNWGALCEDFRPDIQNSKIKPGGIIQCHDSDFVEAQNPEWHWEYSGKNLGNYTEDMMTVPHKIEGPYVIVGKS